MNPSAVFYRTPDSRDSALALAEELSISAFDGAPVEGRRKKERIRFYRDRLGDETSLILEHSIHGLEALLIEEDQLLSIQADFIGPTVKYRRKRGGGRGEMIAKAVGFKGDNCPRVLDVTAGLGGDAFVLASAGCEVALIERVPTVRALLRNALARAAFQGQSDAGLAEIASRMQLLEFDSIEYLSALDDDSLPDVIYVDPMFPERKKSAAVKKEMQVFHRVVGADADADLLFQLALRKAGKRVVVKRPRIADTLGGVEPSHVLAGKRNRFDVYLT